MAGTSSRGNPAMGDVVRSVLVLGAVVLLIFGIGQLVTVTPDEPTSSVDYRDAVGAARDALGPEVLAPDRLPKGWRATSARVRGQVWSLGVVTRDDEFVGLYQGRERKDLLDRYARGDGRGTVDLDGVRWSERRSPKDETILVRTVDGSTVVVSGTAPRREVLDYASSLSSD